MSYQLPFVRALKTCSDRVVTFVSRCLPVCALLTVTFGCDVVDEPEERIRLAAVGKAKAPRQTAGAINVLDTQGEPVSLSRGNLSVTVHTRGSNAVWSAASEVTIDFEAPPLLDVVMVADNSGSEDGFLPDIQGGISSFAHRILAREHDDRVGMIRVSTVADIRHPMTTSQDSYEGAIDELFITNGWTALWDGVRMANDLLVASAADPRGVTGQCYGGRLPAIVAFTDGYDNNSSDEHDTRYEGDGIDTTFNDLRDLQVGGIATTVHTVGVADDIDEEALQLLASETGGKYTNIDTYGQLVGALHGAAAKLQSMVPVCFEPARCDDDEALITVEYKEKGEVLFRQIQIDLDPGC